MCKDNPDVIKGVVGWVDLTNENVKEKLEKLSKNEKLVGIRHIIQDEPDDKYILRDDFCRGIGMLKEFNLKYDILIFNKHLKYAIEFVKRFPDQPFVLDHIAKPDITHHIVSPWNDNIKELASFPNVMVKVSGMVTEAKKDATYEDFVPYLDTIFNAFGVDRIMIGSDWPVCLLRDNYSNVTGIVKRYISKYSEEDQEKILGLNAIKFYGIKI